MTLDNFFENTYCVINGYQKTRPRIYCKDGFSMSVQAGFGIYCSPRINTMSGYTSAEIGYPSEVEPLITEYAEDSKDYTDTVYPYVPCELIADVLEKHGGIDEEKTFERREK